MFLQLNNSNGTLGDDIKMSDKYVQSNGVKIKSIYHMGYGQVIQ